MKQAFSVALVLFVVGFGDALRGSETLDRARQLEKNGDGAGARTLLARAASNAPNDVTALAEYAEFLDEYGDPGCRGAYQKLIAAARTSGDHRRVVSAARRLVALDLLADDRQSAERHLEVYRAAGGTDLTWKPQAPVAETKATITIPGPLRSFGRMAALSPELAPDDLLPSLARNVVTNGYQASHSNEALEQTEYLKLVHRYLSQARELEKLAGAEKTITVENCDSPKAGELLRILGYRMRGGCGSEVVLETVNATRAFLTTDSGFPLVDLEQALRTNRPFAYDFKPTQVPVLYGPEYWLSTKEKEQGEFIDVFLSDPSLCRLYLGLSKLDRETADELRKALPVQRIKAYAHVLDFFGGMFEIRDGKAVIPGGSKSAAAWTELAGSPPDNGTQFFEKLLVRDDGWMASYFDALARIRGPVRDYLTDPARMKRFYMAIRGRVTSPGPARPVFRANADMMLLTTRLWLEPNGKPHVPGNLDVWRNLFVNHPHGKYDGKLTRIAPTWKDPDDVLEALFALCRKAVENEPLKIFMALSDLDRHRAKPLEAATVDVLARAYRMYGSQYAIFNDAPALSDKSILAFMNTAEAVSRLREPLLRSDTAGMVQGLVGIWQIFVRQGSVPMDKADATFAGILEPFGTIRSDRELFDAGRSGVKLLLAATVSNSSDPPQERIIDLLAGTASPNDAEAHTQMVQEMVKILEAQRIISLNLILELADHLDAVAKGEKLNTAMVNRLSSRIAEIQLPRASLSGAEKNALSFGFYTEKHIESERRLNLRATLDRPSGDKERLREARGALAPYLRDTLVAYNYVHYAPPGAQILYTNPLFVRSHDFIGVQGSNHTWRATELFGTGWPSNAGGRLMGSLSGLPYALAEAEQNFLVPSQTQALIWGDLVPQMILSAKIPRWWDVTPVELHWLALHMRYAQTMVAEAALNPAVRKDVLESLSAQAVPARIIQISRLLDQGDVKGAVDKVTPSELYLLGSDMVKRQIGPSNLYQSEIRRLAGEYPQEANYQQISRAFGTPKPTLANSYRPELLNLRTFPTLMGYSSRIMAESWESNTLYWAELADTMYLSPAQLNVRIPEWTQKVVERIFASHLEDWPAVLRSLRRVGEDVRSTAKNQSMAEQKASLQ